MTVSSPIQRAAARDSSPLTLPRGARVPRTRTWTAPIALAAGLLIAGCSVTPEPVDPAANLERARRDLAVLFAPQEPVAAPVTMHEAMARAIKYNLDERVKLMEMAVAANQLDLSR